jgi:hypothetical protein
LEILQVLRVFDRHIHDRNRVPESHRKGAKDAKGDSHAINSKILIDSKKSESNRFPERTTVDDLPTA